MLDEHFFEHLPPQRLIGLGNDLFLDRVQISSSLFCKANRFSVVYNAEYAVDEMSFELSLMALQLVFPNPVDKLGYDVGHDVAVANNRHAQRHCTDVAYPADMDGIFDIAVAAVRHHAGAVDTAKSRQADPYPQDDLLDQD